MTLTSTGRILVPSLVLVAACGAAIAFGIKHTWRAPPPEPTAVTAAPAASPPAAAALATAQAEANDVATQLAVSPPAPVAGESVPAFDVARIDPMGEAVIAGRAAPGATVELLRNGERLDQAVADQSGEFVITPSRLPSGKYELTLRSRLPDGTQATSKHGVAVALDEAPASTGTLQSRAELPAKGPGTNRKDVAVSQPSKAMASAAPPDGGFSSAVAEPKGEPKIPSMVVSRGDSLWRISRLTYGVGTRYAVVYRANRERIRDPNRIYPGQIFILPMTAH